MKKLTFLLGFALLMGCMSGAKLARKCAERFAPSVKNDTISIVLDSTRIDTVVSVDTIRVTGMVVCPDAPTAQGGATVVPVSLPCPCPTQMVTKTRTVEKLRTIELIDSSMSYLHRKKIQILESQVNKLRGQRNVLFWLFVVVMGLLSLGWYLKIKK